MLVMSTAAMQTFRDVMQEEKLFAHAYQIKNMMGQIAMAIGTTAATLFLQWRTTMQYNNLNVHFSASDPLYVEQTQQLAQALSSEVGATTANQISVAMHAQMLQQQSTLVASMEYFWVVIGVAVIALIISVTQKTFR